ncbi:MAG: methionine--tRNA ligase [Chlorobi bacterium]|nr:MAG: methionine--tRNA ligase [Bacteroidota bacterium]MBL1160859.1 methionine--tRNA ligase [Chlorobiota bacterium]MBZ0195538.1 methionine--tRNA ligase [Candidatus Kapabacteria bacterium]MCC6330950.1 methionine--tRNA ligase [Ignavibacteria bacterium]MCL4276499.1 methionine--tRNA ligase [Ignavibacteria bacterium]
MKRYLITSALPYASGITHLGNVVGSTLPADIYARYCRLQGRETLYVCGSDEYGVAITIAAEKEGVTPLELVNKYHTANETALRAIGIDFDVFGRTTDPLHAETAREFFTTWLEKGLLVERDDDQFYDEQSGIFLPDRYVEGVCPNCGYDKARGDQCDSCGAYYNQLDLKNPRSVVSGQTPVVKKTKHWYFKLNEFQQWTEQYIEQHAGEWKDNVLQQSRSWLNQGLAARTATRDLQWGIPVPVEGATGKVLYVWFEAVLGYISATKRWASDKGTPGEWEKWWKDSNTQYTAFLGKDNIVFHTIIFPILLHTRENEGYILPEAVPANEFLNLEGKKFSKSRNWAIDVQQYLAAFPQQEHVDILRYVLTTSMPETKDSDFTWRDYQSKAINELAAILGNLVNRVSLFVHKNYNGVVPEGTVVSGEHEEVLLQALKEATQAAGDRLDTFRFRDAVTEAMNAARAVNKYFNDKAPWKAIKTDPSDAAATLKRCLEALGTVSVLMAPFTPWAAASIQNMLGLEERIGAVGEDIKNVWSEAWKVHLNPGDTVGQPDILFHRIEDDVVRRQLELLTEASGNTNNTNDTASSESMLIDVDLFSKVQLRTAEILEAEAVPKSKKLLKLQVRIGTERRQIIAGIAQHYKPDNLVGKMIVVVYNLKPATLMGMESQGMVLAASNSDGFLTLIGPSDTGVGAGAEVR